MNGQRRLSILMIGGGALGIPAAMLAVNLTEPGELGQELYGGGMVLLGSTIGGLIAIWREGKTER